VLPSLAATGALLAYFRNAVRTFKREIPKTAHGRTRTDSRRSQFDPLLLMTTVCYREIQSKRCQQWDPVAQSRAKISLPMRKAAWPQGHAAADRPA
jgi:hypothetical protein